MLDRDERAEVTGLFKNLRSNLPELGTLLEECTGHWVYEDGVYRFYHESFKVYALQGPTLKIVEALRSLSPGRELNPCFMQIVAEGTGKTFSLADNENWLATTRPILEAFFHARYFWKWRSNMVAS